MFTGIISAIGKIIAIEPLQGDCRIKIDAGKLALHTNTVGDSIAVDGVCLTVVQLSNNFFSADVGAQILATTTLGSVTVGTLVNLEQALTPTTRLGGHIVSGHIDGIGRVIEKIPDGRSMGFALRVPDNLAKYIARLGLIAINGVSLTVNQVNGTALAVNILPFTLQETSLGNAVVGSQVNIEVDLLARYVERLMQTNVPVASYGVVTKELLQNNGFFNE